MMESKFETMLDQIDDEIEGAEKYIKSAIANKDSMPEAFENYMRMASAEMEHAKTLQDTMKRYIEKHDPPKELLAVWNWQTEKAAKKMADIKTKMDVAKR